MNSFDAAAKDWETEKRRIRALAVADKIRSHIKDTGAKTALEYGCGTGLVGFSLMDMFETLYFCDSSCGMIEQVGQKLTEMGLPSERALCLDFMTSELPELRFDCIFLSLALHHIKDTRGILSRFYALLNEGGRLIVVDIDTDDGSFHEEFVGFDGHNGYDQSELCGTTRQVGFAEVSIETFYRDIKKGKENDTPYSLFIMEAVKA
ncbi:MAG: class I SAM-dependent methyltransferase [Eubacteriales bacterium]